jgi:hypothetical protein
MLLLIDGLAHTLLPLIPQVCTLTSAPERMVFLGATNPQRGQGKGYES